MNIDEYLDAFVLSAVVGSDGRMTAEQVRAGIMQHVAAWYADHLQDGES